jgi:DNA polymerase
MLLEMGVRVWLPGTDFALADTGRLPDAASAGQASNAGALRAGAGSMAPHRDAGVSAAQGPVSAVAAAGTNANTNLNQYAATTNRMGNGADLGATNTSRLGTATNTATALSRRDGANNLSQIAAMDWDALARTAADCQACGLCAGRSHSMLHAQSGRHARWMVVGDPPNEDEDAAGQPFTGEDGLLLSNMLKAVGATRGDVVPGLDAAYVTAVSKCRPPQGRVPQPAELAQCAAYLQREIALVQPAVILAMGRFANQVLLQAHPQDAALPLDRQRGKVYRYQGVPVLVTYTPQALRRRPADKAKAWADLCLAMDLLQTPA